MLIASVWRGGARLTFVVGLLLGGLLSAFLAVTVGSLLVRPWFRSAEWGLAVVGLVLVLALLHDSKIVKFRIPQNARQVPERVSSSGPRLGALQFGFEMGTGMRTFMTSLLPHVALVGAILIVPVSVALLMGIFFGAGRALVPLARGLAENEATWSAAFGSRERAIQVALGVAILGAGLASIADGML